MKRVISKVLVLAAVSIALPAWAGGGGGFGGGGFPGGFPDQQGGFQGPGGGGGGQGFQGGPGGFQGGPGGGGFQGGPGGFQGGGADFQGGPGGMGGMGMGGPGGGRGGPGGGIGIDVQVVAGLQVTLESTNEEWKVIGPLLARVVSDVQLLTAADSGALANGGNGMGGMGGRGGGGPGGGNDAFGGPGSTANGGRGGRGGGGRGGFQGGPGGDMGGGPGGPGAMVDPNWVGGFAPGGGVTIVVGSGPVVGAQVGTPGANPTPVAPTSAPASPPAPQPPAAVGGGGAGASTLSATSPAVGESDVSNKTMTLQQAMTDLQTALANGNTSEATLREKIAIVHDARAKTRADLEDARKELLLLLTTDQEAVLVAMGYLP